MHGYADRHHEDGGAPPDRLVRQPPGHGVAGRAFAAAAATPLVRFDDATREDRALEFEALAGDREPELGKAAERGQISAVKASARGSVMHVEVFQMSGLGTFSFGRPRPLPGIRRAGRTPTLNCEEPLKPPRRGPRRPDPLWFARVVRPGFSPSG